MRDKAEVVGGDPETSRRNDPINYFCLNEHLIVFFNLHLNDKQVLPISTHSQEIQY